MTKTPRDTGATDYFDKHFSAGLFGGTVFLGDVKRQYSLPRADFDRLVDWYIGTPQIVAALKAKDVRIRELEDLVLDVTLCADPRTPFFKRAAEVLKRR